MLDLVRGNPRRLAVLARGDGRRLPVHGARSVGHPARRGRGDLPDRRAGGRNVLARRELRVRVHPGQPRRARSVEPRGRRGRRCRGRRCGARARPAAARTVLGGGRARDLSAQTRTTVRRAHRRGRTRTPGTEPTTLLYFPARRRVSVPRPRRGSPGLPLAERVLRPARRAGYDRMVVWLPTRLRDDSRQGSSIRGAAEHRRRDRDRHEREPNGGRSLAASLRPNG